MTADQPGTGDRLDDSSATAHLLRSPANAARLIEAINRLEQRSLVPAPWDPNHDPDEPCNRPGCGHPYYRHFDDDFETGGAVAVGCKYCGDAFNNIYVPEPVEVGTTGWTAIIETGTSTQVSLHAGQPGAFARLVEYVDANWANDMDTARPAGDHESVAAYFTSTAGQGKSYLLIETVVQR